MIGNNDFCCYYRISDDLKYTYKCNNLALYNNNFCEKHLAARNELLNNNENLEYYIETYFQIVETQITNMCSEANSMANVFDRRILIIEILRYIESHFTFYLRYNNKMIYDRFIKKIDEFCKSYNVLLSLGFDIKEYKCRMYEILNM